MASVADLVPQALLAGAVRRLTARYAGVFPPAAVRAVVEDSYLELVAASSVHAHLPLLSERFAGERLDALGHTGGRAPDSGPRVLFVCTANSGRSQLAAALFNRHAHGAASATSAGTAPAAKIESAVVAALAEIGIDAGDAFPKPVTDEVVQAADMVVTLGCADAPPLLAGRRYADWPVADPGGSLDDVVRGIRDDIDARVRALLAELGAPDHR
ncbi:three-helix bundle dimerization domain-containing protein [Yinghuangia sp. YIM S09857]|uniref:arsenate reductase/protein-tyrosine-phosphatase family protein n=1 Tax=Yinghuangia sp. YIM S09857 TaxID=3436929 RepID=UPI003F532937